MLGVLEMNLHFHIFVKFTEMGCFNLEWLRLVSLSILTSPPSHFLSYRVVFGVAENIIGR